VFAGPVNCFQTWLTAGVCWVLLASGGIESCLAATDSPAMWVFVGTYTGRDSKGIYASRFDPATGKLSAPELAAEIKNPTFLALHPNKQFLYAVGETQDSSGKQGGRVSAFKVDAKTGKLQWLNTEGSAGAGPCHLSVDPQGRCLLIANYGNGSIGVRPLEKDGRLGAAVQRLQNEGSSVNRERQSGPHAHFIMPDLANRFIYACDLGLDKVFIYQLHPAQPALSANHPPFAKVSPGAGPRHLAFHPNGQWVYCINEMGCTITAFRRDAKSGALDAFQEISTRAQGASGQNTCAEIQVHATGKFLCGSNRGDDSLVVFSVDQNSGKLARLQEISCGGKTPRFFNYDPSGRWLLAANQDSANVVVFEVERASGKLTATGQSLQLASPVCAVFLPAQP
jgi:6-phosphogluconolactonase